MFLEYKYRKIKNSNKILNNNDENIIDKEEIDKKIYFKDILKLGLIFWCICIISFTIGDAFTTFVEISTDFFAKMYGLHYQTAANVVSIMTFMPILYGLIIGIIADKFKKKAIFYMISSFLSTASFLYAYLKPIDKDNG